MSVNKLASDQGVLIETHFRTRTTLQLRFYLPGQSWLAKLLEHDIGAFGVNIFGIKKEAVHIEDASANGRESDD